MGKYAMNLNDGKTVFNSGAVASNVNYVVLDDDIHAALKNGSLEWTAVANAVRAKRNNDASFDWQNYDKLRERLNVRKADFSLKNAKGDVTGVDADKTEEASVNPSVSFVELRKTEKRDASPEPNDNVGVLSHAQKPKTATKVNL